MKKNKKLGLFFILSPWAILVVLSLLLIIFTKFESNIINHLFPLTLPSVEQEILTELQTTPDQIFYVFIKFGLLFLIELDILYIFIGLMTGIHFLKKKNQLTSMTQETLHTNYRKKGVFLIVSPWVILIIILASAIVSAYLLNKYETLPFLLSPLLFGSIIVGILDIPYIFIGLVFGIRYLKKAHKILATKE